jgi:hypothetical protein
MIPGIELQEANAERTRARQRLERLKAHAQDHGLGLPPEHASCVAAEKEIARTSDAARRLQERSERLAAAWRAAAEPLAACETWLRDGRPSGVQLLDWEGDEPKLLKGENGLLDAIENRRRRVRELRANLNRIASASYPSGYCKARAKEQIEALAMQGTPTVAMLVEHDGDLIWPMTRLRSEVLGGEHPALAFAEVPDTIALIAWLHRDTLIKRLDAEIDTESDDASALSHETRAQAEAETMGDMLDIERQEAALTWEAQAQGLPVEFRGDINPLALLSLRLVTPPRADGLPPTSPGLSWDLLR